MWLPIPLDDLRGLIRQSEAEMGVTERLLWGLVAIPPEKWALPPWGDLGGGFWAVGLIGRQVIWYNDIEDGCNVSRYEAFGVISKYWCNQDELHHVIWQLREQIEAGTPLGRFGPREPWSGGTA
jgi:hypothetical protein